MALQPASEEDLGIMKEDILIDLFNKGMTYSDRPLMLNFEVPYKLLPGNNPTPDSFHVMIDDSMSRITLASIKTVCNNLKEQVEQEGIKPLKIEVLKKAKFLPVAYIVDDTVNPNSKSAHRVEVICVDESRLAKDGNVNITFVDSGAEAWVSSTTLFPPSADFLRHPRLAIHCHLSQIVPLEGKHWPQRDYKTLLGGNGTQKQKLMPVVMGVRVAHVYLEIDGVDVGLKLVTIMALGNYTPLDFVDRETLQKYKHRGEYPVVDFSELVGAKIPVYGINNALNGEASIQTSTFEANTVYDILEAFDAKQHEMEAKDIKVGAAVVVKRAEDGLFYRGTIQNTAGPKKCLIKLVDYLAFEAHPNEALYKVPEELMKIPEASNKCYIAELMGVSLTDEQVKKLNEVIVYKDLYARIGASEFRSPDHERAPWPILTLYVPDGDEGKDIPLSEFLKIPSSGATFYNYYCQHFTLMNTSVGSALFDGASNYFPGKKYRAVFVCADSEKSIWLQMERDEERALQISREMTEFYNDWINCPIMTPEMASVDSFVAAKQPEDPNWYRAKIIQSNPETNKYHVVFLDYGNQEVVELEGLKPLINYFGREKCFALQVGLPVEVLPGIESEDIVSTIYGFCETGSSYLDVWLQDHYTFNYAWLLSSGESLSHCLLKSNKAKLLVEPDIDIFG